MTCNLNGGRIYKGSIAEITVPMFPRCYTGETEDLVVNFYTTTGTSIEFSVSAGTITLDGFDGTVVFQVPQLGVLEDGLLRYHTACGEDYGRDWESRWFVVTPNDYTPVEYVTSDNVDAIVASSMTGYLTIEVADQTYAKISDVPVVTGYTTTGDVLTIVTANTTAFTTSAQVESMITSATTGYTTTGDVESMITSATTGYTTSAQVESIVTANTTAYTTSAQVETTLEDYAKLSDIPSLDGYATESYVTAATQSMVTSSTIDTIWVGTEQQYEAITNKLNTTLYIIK